jgi:hypothetical protein
MYMIEYIYSYLFAYATITTVFVYGINLPTLVTGETSLVKTYYNDNYKTNLLLDFVLVFIYLSIACVVMKHFSMTNIFYKLMTVILVTLGISGGFYMFFISQPQSKSFFSKWFHTVKHKAVIYDILLVGSIFLMSEYLVTKFT